MAVQVCVNKKSKSERVSNLHSIQENKVIRKEMSYQLLLWHREEEGWLGFLLLPQCVPYSVIFHIIRSI